MKKITENPILISAVVIVILFLIGVFISTFLVRNRLDNQFNGSKYELLFGSIEGDIVVTNDNFNILMLTLKNPNIENQENISFQLLKDGQVVRELHFFGSNVGDPSDVRLQFAPIPDSAGNDYKVKLSISESNKPLSVFVGDDGSIAYRAYYRSTNKLLVIQYFATSFVSRLFSDMVFVGIWASLIILAFMIYKK
jgi:hypothetical protein